jgi:Rrf2 family protein
MIGFSQTLGYAVQILSCLSPTEARLGRNLSLGAAVPAPYMSKLVHRLGREGLVITKRGRKGGIILARSPEQITLLEIVQAIEGRHWVEPSLLSMDTCLVLKQVPLEDFWRNFVRQLEAKLKETTLADLTRNKHSQEPARTPHSRPAVPAPPPPSPSPASGAGPDSEMPSSPDDGEADAGLCLFGLGR